MKYSDLIDQLQQLEQQWRGSPHPSPSLKLYPSHSLIRQANNIQYFACSNATAGKDLPIVVTVGINYTQGANKIPDQSQHFSKPPRSGFPFVEDIVNAVYEKLCIQSFNLNPNIWKECCLASIKMIAPILKHQGFHLVMTNLSPWITNVSWASNIDAAPGAELLNSPPHCLKASPVLSPFDHLDAFYKQLGSEVALWIGHGLEVVSPHFRSFVHKHQIANWLLTANTASGCKPQIQSGPTIKFRR